MCAIYFTKPYLSLNELYEAVDFFFFFFSFFSFPFSFLLPSLREMEKGLAAERGCRLKKHFLVRVLSEILVQDENKPSQLKASWIIRFLALGIELEGEIYLRGVIGSEKASALVFF